MNTKVLGLVLGVVAVGSVLAVIFATGIIGAPIVSKTNSTLSISGYSFYNNTAVSVSLNSPQTGTITKAQLCDVSNNCYSEAIAFSYPGKLYLNLNAMVGAVFAFQYYTNYTVIATTSGKDNSFQIHYSDPYPPILANAGWASNNTEVSLVVEGWNSGTGSSGGGTIIKEQVCNSVSSCYSETWTFNYFGQLALNLNQMTLTSGTAFTFQTGNSYNVILTNPDEQSYTLQITR